MFLLNQRFIFVIFSSVAPHRGQPAAKCNPWWQPTRRLAVSCGLGRRRIRTRDCRTTVWHATIEPPCLPTEPPRLPTNNTWDLVDNTFNIVETFWEMLNKSGDLLGAFLTMSWEWRWKFHSLRKLPANKNKRAAGYIGHYVSVIVRHFR